ncbi:MAG: hypothetical protein A2W25_14930 [candidate division Zixibacteria bacterium RBG_16_53_22]|nr:MAG: hypothetical protein A2W25_14930 [candidate division Zixibacteria bacterium RBG_16_53_22]
MISFKSRYPAMAIVTGTAILCLAVCDNRSFVAEPNPEPAFSGDINVVRDYSQRKTIAEFSFFRDGDTIPDGVVRLNDLAHTESIHGVYSLEAPLQAVFGGLNTVEFASLRDNYSSSIAIHMPDSFGVRFINPRDNSGINNVSVQWSQPDFATRVLLVVVARNYPANGSIPYITVLDADVTTHIIPYTAFEDQTGFAIRDTYYLYLAAFNQGFGGYTGLNFPLPPNLPKRRISNPAGFATYGTVAPVDSVLVLP